MRPFIAILMIFLFILAILWFLLPFAIFGTKDKLQTLIDSNIETNKKLDQLIALQTSNKNPNT